MQYLEALLLSVVASLPAIASGLAVIVASWSAAVAMRAVSRRFGQRAGLETAGVAGLVSMLVYWVVLGFGIVTGLGTMGVNVSALVASLGLTGFALGFALRDAIANLLAGILILVFRPFHYGDRIKVVGFEGTVIGIDLRYTTIRGASERHLIPNQT